MRALDALEVRHALVTAIQAGTPFLGICLGLQALFEASEEAPSECGLGILPGCIRRFRGDARIPHMGWNSLDLEPQTRLFRNLPPAPYVYFAHSYYAPLVNGTAATCTYTLPYTAALEQGNLYGVQFHPEKSGPVGLQIVRNFLASC